MEIETLTPIVARVLKIEDITTGTPEQHYLARYRGRLYGDSAQAYDQLAESLRPYDITPMFQQAGEQHVVLLFAGTLNPTASNPWVNLLLFGLTVASVVFTGAMSSYECSSPVSGMGELLSGVLQNLHLGIPFTVSLLAILLAHEFGHYLAARYHRTHVTLPYFIPFPLSILGTMGAFIRLKEPPKNKRILLDIGIAGPIAGLVVAIPVLLYGLSLSTVEAVQPLRSACFPQEPAGLTLEGNSLLYLGAKFAIFGQLLPQPADYGNLSPALYWIRYFFTGQPLPIGGTDVFIHPIAWAGWAGLLVTALNLIPAGQLDGGHVVFVLLGHRTRRLLPLILVGLVLLGFAWPGWWLWAFLLLILGRMYAEPLDQITTLDPRRKTVALLGILLFILVFSPVPLLQFIP